jgi:1-acyl-sn-glycerol-3-phosphate acyltransferase
MEWKLRPARDHGLSATERARSHARESGLVSTALNAAWRRGVRLYLRAFHRLSVTGAGNIPRPPFVMVANHASHLDALTLVAALRGEAGRRAVSLAAGDVFFARTASAAFAAHFLNAFPVWRKRSRPKDLATLRERLAEDGLVFVIFPEGTRSRTGAMAPFLPGIGALVAGSAVPILPCYLDGAHAAWPPERRLPRAGPLHLAIGAPISLADLANDRAGWEETARRTEAAVRALAPPGRLAEP